MSLRRMQHGGQQQAFKLHSLFAQKAAERYLLRRCVVILPPADGVYTSRRATPDSTPDSTSNMCDLPEIIMENFALISDTFQHRKLRARARDDDPTRGFERAGLGGRRDIRRAIILRSSSGFTLIWVIFCCCAVETMESLLPSTSSKRLVGGLQDPCATLRPDLRVHLLGGEPHKAVH